MFSRFSILFLLPFLLFDCTSKELPVLNNPVSQNNEAIEIADFALLNQDSVVITNATFSEKIYIADFIFLSCPTICPKMNNSMLQVYKQFETDPRVQFISHTIDPKNDSISLLKKYSNNLNVSSTKWHFVTGNIDTIYKLAEKSYFTSVENDSLDTKNYIHSGGLLLVDKNKHIRGVYDGTSEIETKRLIEDLKILLQEQF